MPDDQFTKLFQNMTKRFDTVEAKLDDKADRAQVAQLLVAIDRLAAGLETDETERGAMAQQLDRHEGWITQLADRTDTKLAGE